MVYLFAISFAVTVALVVFLIAQSAPSGQTQVIRHRLHELGLDETRSAARRRQARRERVPDHVEAQEALMGAEGPLGQEARGETSVVEIDDGLEEQAHGGVAIEKHGHLDLRPQGAGVAPWCR